MPQNFSGNQNQSVDPTPQKIRDLCSHFQFLLSAKGKQWYEKGDKIVSKFFNFQKEEDPPLISAGPCFGLRVIIIPEDEPVGSWCDVKIDSQHSDEFSILLSPKTFLAFLSPVKCYKYHSLRRYQLFWRQEQTTVEKKKTLRADQLIKNANMCKLILPSWNSNEPCFFSMGKT